MGSIFDIKRFALHDGPGLRTTVFLKGCPLSCLGCHNPEGQQVGPELIFRPDRCTACGDCLPVCPQGAISLVNPPQTGTGVGAGNGSEPGDSNRAPIHVDWDRCDLHGACVVACLPGALEMVGRPRSAEEVLSLLEDDRIYYDESRGGVTFSGGEPFSQPDFLRELLEGCRDRELPVVLDTCGHVLPQTFRELAPLARALLFDLKLVDEERHEAFTGVHNRWILENLRWAAGGCVEDTGPEEGGAGEERQRSRGQAFPFLTVRFPLIPGVNDDEENLEAMADLLVGLRRPPPVDILPYHRLGVDKYHRMGREYHLSEVAPPATESVQRAVRLLEEAGLAVTVRGERNGKDR